MNTIIYWFRNDLRLADNAALTRACAAATHILPVYCHPPDAVTPWGFARAGAHRRHFLASALADLASQLRSRGSDLIELQGQPQDILRRVATAVGATSIFCEMIAAPEEAGEIAALRMSGISIDTIWHSTLLSPAELPFAPERMPDVFSAFRHALERAEVLPAVPLPIPATIPPLPDLPTLPGAVLQSAALPELKPEARSSFPYHLPAFSGGATAANVHLDQYFARKLAHTYKATRNGLSGTDYSSKFSPWLASGALSPRTAYAALKRFEAEHGANDGSYWLWFELLWRDYFRILHLKHGLKLYRARGLSSQADPAHHPDALARWRAGKTGEPLIDAGMRELAATGYLSNRLRQNVASYLIHDLGCDWRAGAAWFEAQLIDYDVYSNQGNWLYIAGRGTNPRDGRRFNPQKQARDYDPQGHYRALWSSG